MILQINDNFVDTSLIFSIVESEFFSDKWGGCGYKFTIQSLDNASLDIKLSILDNRLIKYERFDNEKRKEIALNLLDKLRNEVVFHWKNSANTDGLACKVEFDFKSLLVKD